MNIIYFTNNTEHRAILFSKKEVKSFQKIFNKTIFNKSNDIFDALEEIKFIKNAPTRIYAIRKGFVSGIVIDYDDFRKLTNGYSEFKGKKCKNIMEAYNYLYNTAIPKNLSVNHLSKKDKKNNITPECKTVTKKHTDAIKYKAYTDGSYYCTNNVMGIGYEIYCNDKVFSHSSFIKVDKKASSTTAELISAMMAIERSIDEGLKSLTIVHDNAQVKTFAISPSSKNKFSREYHEFIKAKSNLIDIHFEKVKSHSGDVQNDKVDRMIRHKKIDKFINLL